MLSTTLDGAVWENWCREAGVQDVYWSWDHLQVWASEWNSLALGSRWTDQGDTILHPVLLVPLDGLNGGKGRFDVRTAYDFGGPLHVGGKPIQSMSLFEEEWTEWARRKGVVTEFLRLHPIALSVRPTWAELHALNHVVDLLRSYEEIRASYHHSWQRGLRKAERQGYQVEVSDSPDDEQVEAFLGLYRAAMVRLEAKPWFRFNDETLKRFFSLPGTSLVSVREEDNPVALASILRSGKTLFYHLGCSRQSALPGRPNHLLFDTIIRHGQEAGLASLHLGGGSKSLQRFKSHMADSTVPYFIVRRVLDSEAYERLCRDNPASREGADFPAYLRSLFR